MVFSPSALQLHRHSNSHFLLFPCRTGAGLGSFLTFATFMKREQGAVKLGTITPFLNNVVRSLPSTCNVHTCMHMIIFCTLVLTNASTHEQALHTHLHTSHMQHDLHPHPSKFCTHIHILHTCSMICGIMVFCTVFSVQSEEGLSTDEIVGRLADNGPANTGLTFIWYAKNHRSHDFVCILNKYNLSKN